MSASFDELISVMDRLRRECPWTSQQTHDSLAPYVLEEAHETLEALDSGDTEQLRDELGDLLLQVVFHARIAADDSGWDIDDVVRGLREKLVRRNPHVFGQTVARTAADVDAAWQQAKDDEHAGSSVVADTAEPPQSLPALARASKLLQRADSTQRQQACAGDDLASRFLALVDEANAGGADPEQLVRTTIQTRFGAATSHT